jgi:DNA-binding transcriptional MerR regulator
VSAEPAPTGPAAGAADPTSRLDDPDFPALTMSQAAELLGVQAAFLRSLDVSGVLEPHRSPGGHRRYSRAQLTLAARMRGLLDDGHSLSSAETIVGLQDQLASARADADQLRRTTAQLRSDVERLRPDPGGAGASGRGPLAT